MDTRNRTLWIGLGVLAFLALLASSPLGHAGLMMSGPSGVHPFIGAPWLIGLWGFGLLLRVLFIGGLLFLVVRVFGGSRRRA